MIGAAPNFDPDHAGTDPPRVRPRARIRCRHRHASRFRKFAGRYGHPSRLRTDRAARTRRARGDRARLQIFDDEGDAFPCSRETDRRCRRCRDIAAGDRSVHAGPGPNRQCPPRRRRRQCAGRAWRQLFDLHQQRAQSVHAAGRLFADPDGQPAGQCLSDRPGAAVSRAVSRC